MNVLLFVVTLIMVLAMMTYARLDSYRSTQTFQFIFNYYMENDERGYINLQAKPLYDKIVVANKGGKGGGKKAQGSPRIGILPLINQIKRDEKPKEWQQTKILLKNLIAHLYQNHPFFKQAVEANPMIVDELIAAITTAVDALPKNQPLKSAKELGNLKLDDPSLDQLLYKILHGSPCKMMFPGDKAKKVSEEVKIEVPQEQSESEQQNEQDKGEYNSTEGYCSLLDYITADSSPKVRVYLAPRDVLSAIFHDPQTVNEIIAERKRLFHAAITTEGDTKELGSGFKDRFDRLKDSAIDKESLSYDVSKTNPKDYE